MEKSEPRPAISVVIPVFNEEDVLPLTYARLCQLAERLPVTWEWLFINDGSSDRTYDLLRELAQRDRRVKVLHFSRNFGHQIAITAGVDLADGDTVVIIDADLQDPPELIIEMYELYRQGYDVVYAQRKSRLGETWFKKNSARFFYWMMKTFVHKKLPENVGDFRLMSRAVVEAMRYFPEKARFYRGLVCWSGFRQTSIQFDRQERAAGKTKYPFYKMLRFACDAAFAFSYMPLRIASGVGLLMILLSLLYLAYIFYLYLFVHSAVRGWTSLVALVIILQGMMLMFIGLLGEYIGRIYEEVKQRPLYIVQQTHNLPVIPGRLPSGGVLISQHAGHGQACLPEQKP